jgi:hypothetical protein
VGDPVGEAASAAIGCCEVTVGPVSGVAGSVGLSGAAGAGDGEAGVSGNSAAPSPLGPLGVTIAPGCTGAGSWSCSVGCVFPSISVIVQL